VKRNLHMCCTELPPPTKLNVYREPPGSRRPSSPPPTHHAGPIASASPTTFGGLPTGYAGLHHRASTTACHRLVENLKSQDTVPPAFPTTASVSRQSGRVAPGHSPQDFIDPGGTAATRLPIINGRDDVAGGER
jgi:hypothetical protein